MSAENKTALSTCIALIRISRRRSVHPCASVDCSEISRRVQPPISAGRLREQPLSFFRGRLEVSEDILDQNYRRIDDDAEIHRADGKQVGAFALHHQEDDGEEQRKRDVQSNDDGAAKITEENPLDQENQQAPENQVVQHRVRGDRNQR